MAVDDNPLLLFDYNQRLFELVTNLRPKSLLLIGGGAYTLPSALLAALPKLEITVVEVAPHLMIQQLDPAGGALLKRNCQVHHRLGMAFRGGCTPQLIRALVALRHE